MKNTFITLSATLLLCPTAFAVDKINVHGIIFNVEIFNTVLPPIADKRGVELQYTAHTMPYIENLEQELIYNSSIDIASVLSAAAPRLYAGNWIKDLSAYPEIMRAAGMHYANTRNALYLDDKLLGLGYGAMIQNMPVIDLEAYAALGLGRENFPVDWPDLYRQVTEIAEQGAQSFFYPAWHSDVPGLALSFLTDVWNRGGHFLDPRTEAPSLLQHGGAAYDTLLDWRRVWESGAIPTDILDQSFMQYRAICARENFAISVQSSEMLLLPAAESTPQRKLVPIPRVSQNWGTLIVMMNSIIDREEDDSAQLTRRQILLDISRGEGAQKLSLAKLALKNDGLLSVYQDFMQSSDAQEILASKFPQTSDVDALLDIYQNAEFTKQHWNQVWHQEFSRFLQVELKHYLKNPEVDPQNVITRLNEKLKSLKKSYGY